MADETGWRVATTTEATAYNVADGRGFDPSQVGLVGQRPLRRDGGPVEPLSKPAEGAGWWTMTEEQLLPLSGNSFSVSEDYRVRPQGFSTVRRHVTTGPSRRGEGPVGRTRDGQCYRRFVRASATRE